MRKITVLLLCLFLSAGMDVYAAEEYGENTEKQIDSLMQKFDFSEINRILRQIAPEEKLDFGRTVNGLIRGDTEASAELFGKLISDQFFYEFRYNRKGLVRMLLIAVIAAVFANFSSVFKSEQIGEIGFYVLYMLLLTICLHSFQVVSDSVGEKLELLTVFMRALGPVYFLSVAVSSGSGSAVAFYNLTLFLIYLVEVLILNFLLPLLHIYVVVKVLNHLSAEDYLSKLAELIEFVVVWTLKTLLAAVSGLNLVQGLTAPAIDSLKRGVVTKGLEALPAVGDALGGLAETLLGTAVLVKNGIGVTGAVICIAVCALPAVQMLVMTALYKLTAAVIQPVSDARIVGCISDMGDAGQIMVRLIFTTGVLFLITIAVVTATTT